MKTLRITIIVFTLWVGPMHAWAGSSLLKSAEWPFSPPTLFLKGGVNAVTAGDGLLFWAIGDTVAVIDKNSFSYLSTFQVSTSTAIQDMLFAGTTDTLYVAAGYDKKEHSGGLQIFDLSEPTNPMLIVIYDESPDNPGASRINSTDGEEESVAVPDIDARGIGLFEGIIYLADDNFGLRVIDVITDPTQPTEVPLTTTTEDRSSGYKQPDIKEEFTATGGYVNLSLYPYGDKIYAFVLDFYHGVKVFDVTHPAVIADPVLRDTRSNIWFGSVSLLSDIFVTETNGRLTAFVTSGNATGSDYVLARLDASFDEELPIANFGRCIMPGEARSVCASGDYAYVADGESGLTVVDISDVPETGSVLTYKKVGSYTTEADFSYNVFLEGAILYLSTGESGLNKLDVSNPATPALIDRLESPISGDDVCVSGNYTYMLDRQKGLRIFDSSEPSYPLLQSFLSFEGPSTDLAVSGGYAYIATSSNGIAIVDVTKPLVPVLTGATIPSPKPRKLFISGNMLYIADEVTGLQIVDITAPLNPDPLGSVATAGVAVSVFVYANRAYVAEGEDGVDIFNVSNPADPRLLISADMTDARDINVFTSGGSVFTLVADGISGLKILDVTDVGNPLPEPVVVNTMDTDTETPSAFSSVSVTTLGNLAFVGMGADGILVLNLDNPLIPKEIDHESSGSYSSDIIAQTIAKKPYITVAEKFIGFRILYLYTSSDTDDTEDLVPTIDAGCFIGAVSDPLSRTGWDKKWADSFWKYFSRFIPCCSQHDTNAGCNL